MAPRDIIPGKEWGEAIIDGISQCPLMILIFSSHSNQSQQVRRTRLEEALAGAKAPMHLTQVTYDAAVAREWFASFEGAGLDGVVAKPLGATRPTLMPLLARNSTTAWRSVALAP